MGRIVSGTGRVVPAAALDAHADGAAALLAAARADADAIRARAAADRDEAMRQGRAAGARGGRRRDGRAAGRSARPRGARLREAATPAAIALATKMAEQIVGRAVALAPEVMADIVGAALDACRPRGDWVRVRVHPDDAAAVTARRDALAGRAPAAAALELVADDAVGRHGCVIETAVGRVDARLETQLAALERASSAERDAWLSIDLGKALARLEAATPRRESGRVTEVTGLVIRAPVPGVRVGELVASHRRQRIRRRRLAGAEVVGFRGDEVVLMPLGEPAGIGPDSLVTPTGRPFSIAASDGAARARARRARPADRRRRPDRRARAAWAVDRAAPDPLSRRAGHARRCRSACACSTRC